MNLSEQTACAEAKQSSNELNMCTEAKRSTLEDYSKLVFDKSFKALELAKTIREKLFGEDQNSGACPSYGQHVEGVLKDADQTLDKITETLAAINNRI